MSSHLENDFLESFTDIEVSMSSEAAGKKIRLPLSDSNTLESDISEITDDREHFSIIKQLLVYIGNQTE